jgi:hypothetical protein
VAKSRPRTSNPQNQPNQNKTTATHQPGHPASAPLSLEEGGREQIRSKRTVRTERQGVVETTKGQTNRPQTNQTNTQQQAPTRQTPRPLVRRLHSSGRRPCRAITWPLSSSRPPSGLLRGRAN